jgi:transglutaminase-like putative cysteine protease
MDQETFLMQATAPLPSSRLSIPGASVSGVLLAIMLLALATSLRSAEWTAGMGLLAPVVLGGFLLGVALSYSRWSGLFPVVQSLVVGTAAVLYWISQAPEIPADLSSADRVMFIGQSLGSWLVLLFGDEPARSNLVFLLQLSILLWWLGYLSAWAVFREGRVWRAIIPVGLVLLVNTYFGPPGLGLYFVIFVVCALLLAVRSYLSEKEIAWRIERVRYANDIQMDFLRDGFLFALLVVALAVFLPNAGSNGAMSTALEPLRTPWRDAQQEWGRLFSTLNYQGVAVGDPVFGDTLTLGGARNLGDQLIIEVSSSQGRYWRAAAYDTFTGRRWLNTSTATQAIDGASHVRTPQFQARNEITQTVTIHASGGNVLFAAGQPLRVSLKATADLFVVEEAPGDFPPVAEIAMLHRREAALRPGDRYLAVSSLSRATIEDLQEAGTEYPAWVTENYLELPSDLAPQVGELARQVTANANTPYDQLVAIEQFLRGFTYNDQIAAPPPGVNAVNYFLFDIQEGYCDYYASSFAMMARTLGIPARVSAGYSQGDYLPDADLYQVREYHGHSWPEAFFPGYGWVEFEPTAAELEIVRDRRLDTALPTLPREPFPDLLDDEMLGPEMQADPGGASQTDLGADQAGIGVDSLRALWWVGLLALALVVGFLFWRRRQPVRQRARQRALLDPLFTTHLYGRLMQWAQRLRLPLAPSQTPNEQAAALVAAVPDGRYAIQSITDLYVEDLYSPREPNQRKSEQALLAWSTLLPLLRRSWLQVRLGSVANLRRIAKRSPKLPPDS